MQNDRPRNIIAMILDICRTVASGIMGVYHLVAVVIEDLPISLLQNRFDILYLLFYR